MVIYIGADHRGFELKEMLKVVLKDSGYEVFDVGNFLQDKDDDYPDYAAEVASRVGKEYETSRGILICGSGTGMCVVANKFPKVRAGVATSTNQAFDSRNDNNTNVLCLAAGYTDSEEVKKIVATWLSAPFSEEARHQRRVDKIRQIELWLGEREKKNIFD